MSTTGSENPGQPFKMNREKLGLSVQDVSIAIKINPRILKALEDGDRAGLPPNSFARGFIRSYAAYLKIDSKPILEAYNLHDLYPLPSQVAENTDAETTDSKNQEKSTQNASLPADATLKSKLYLSIGLVAIVMLIFGVRQVFNKYAQERIIDPDLSIVKDQQNPSDSNEDAADGNPSERIIGENGPQLNQDEKKSELLDETKLENSKNRVEPSSIIGSSNTNREKIEAPTAPATSSTAITAPPVDETLGRQSEKNNSKPANENKAKQSNSDANQNEPKLATLLAKSPLPTVTNSDRLKMEKANAEKLAAEKANAEKANAEKLAAEKANAEKANAEKLAAEKAATAPSNQRQELILEAMDKVEIKVSVDGAPSKSYVLPPDGIHTIKAQKSIRVDVKDGGMINVIYNGQDRGVSGDLGRPTVLKFP